MPTHIGGRVPSHSMDSGFYEWKHLVCSAVWKVTCRIDQNFWTVHPKLATMSADTVQCLQVTRNIVQHCWQVSATRWSVFAVWIICEASVSYSTDGACHVEFYNANKKHITHVTIQLSHSTTQQGLILSVFTVLVKRYRTHLHQKIIPCVKAVKTKSP